LREGASAAHEEQESHNMGRGKIKNDKDSEMNEKQIKQLTKLNWDKATKELWDSITLDVSKIKINYEEIKHLD